MEEPEERPVADSEFEGSVSPAAGVSFAALRHAFSGLGDLECICWADCLGEVQQLDGEVWRDKDADLRGGEDRMSEACEGGMGSGLRALDRWSCIRVRACVKKAGGGGSRFGREAELGKCGAVLTETATEAEREGGSGDDEDEAGGVVVSWPSAGLLASRSTLEGPSMAL